MTPRPQLTPMLRHYLEVKAVHPDALLMYRMGDFYEMFFEDAVEAAPILEIALTARQKGTDNEAPMCGVPHHALESYLRKLVRAGRKVAICDQVEDPAEAKGLVKREVTRVVTPGTLSDPGLLEGDEENLLCAVSWNGESGAAALLDVSTGRLNAFRWGSIEQALGDLGLRRPREIVFAEDAFPPALLDWAAAAGICTSPLDAGQVLSNRDASRLLQDQLSTASLRGYGLSEGEPAVLAAATALAYARDTQYSDLEHVNDLQVWEEQRHLMLDETTVRNLDLCRNQRDGGLGSTLLSVVGRTRTPMGGRAMRDCLLRPLLDRREIVARHDAVQELVESPTECDSLRQQLSRIADLERLVARAVLATLTPREAAAVRESLSELPSIASRLVSWRSEILTSFAALDLAVPLSERLAETLADDPSISVKQGGVIAEGVNVELDKCRSLARNTKQHILDLESRERGTTGIGSLKIGFNRVFGYFIEVRKAHLDRVPDHYIRKQTLVNAERFVTEEVKLLEEQILDAEARLMDLESAEYAALVGAIAAESETLQTLSTALAMIDVLSAFADTALARSYCRPQMGHLGDPLSISDGRHPVIEVAVKESFVPNDTRLQQQDAQIMILTGPNMGGKSTYLRQVALISLLAQAGSFVPARAAELGLVDRIFTRVGASDDLARGESTFMVEMIETANILRTATADSLVILDEVGRGTATFDGLSLAWAIVEHLHAGTRPKTVFATHYHELTELASILPGVVNFNLAVKEWEQRIVFLRRVVPGAADKSYGIHVARLAGLPVEVLERASEVLANLEKQEYDLRGRPRLAEGELAPETSGPDQLALFTPPEELVAAILRDLDLDRLTPLAALNLLTTLRSRLDGGAD